MTAHQANSADPFPRFSPPIAMPSTGQHDATLLVGADGPIDAVTESVKRSGDDQPERNATSVFPRGFGDFQLVRELGSGGMGVVYEARQTRLKRTVALKMVRSGFLATEREKQRFQNEAEAIALLDHPNIVPVYEVGDCEGQRFFSMKLIAGGNLSSRLDDLRGSYKEAVRLMRTIATAVHHAHRRGILHCDLKPANILIDEQGEPHVTDFGLAKRAGTDNLLSATASIMGTPPYMAPEQIADKRTNLTTATDVYGLGAVLYALLTGRAPFSDTSILATLNQVREQPPEAPSKHQPGVPRDLETICLKCLEKDPQRRYESAQNLADDLARWLAGKPIHARPVGSVVRIGMWCKRKPAFAGLMLGLAAAICIGFAGMAMLWQRAKSERDEKELQRIAAVKAQAEAERTAAQLRIAVDEIDQRREAELELREREYELESELEIVESEIRNLSEDRNRKSTQLELRASQINSLRKRLAEAAKESSKLRELEYELQETEQEMARLQSAQGEIVSQLDLRAAEVDQLRKKLAAAESEKQRIRQQLDAQSKHSRSKPYLLPVRRNQSRHESQDRSRSTVPTQVRRPSGPASR